MAPPAADRHLWEITAVRDLFWIAIVVILLWFGYYLRSIFTPVLIGLALAYVFNPLINHAEQRWRLPRSVTILSLIAVLVMIGAGVVAWLGPVIADQVMTLARKMPSYVKSLSDQYDIHIGEFGEQVREQAIRVQQDPFSILGALFTGTSEAFGFIGSVIGMTTYLLISLLLIPVYFFFFAWRFPPMIRKIKDYLPASRKHQIVRIARRMDEAVAEFLRGRLLIAVIMGVMFSIGWLIVGVPYWFLLGMATGLISLIPYAAGIGWPFAVLLKYLDITTAQGAAGFDWMSVVVWPSAVYFAVQLIEGWILTPWIQSKSTNISAVTILIVIFIGGAVGGLYGLILAVPLTACLKIFIQEVVLTRLEQWASEH